MRYITTYSHTVCAQRGCTFEPFDTDEPAVCPVCGNPLHTEGEARNITEENGTELGSLPPSTPAAEADPSAPPADSTQQPPQAPEHTPTVSERIHEVLHSVGIE